MDTPAAAALACVATRMTRAHVAHDADEVVAARAALLTRVHPELRAWADLHVMPPSEIEAVGCGYLPECTAAVRDLPAITEPAPETLPASPLLAAHLAVMSAHRVLQHAKNTAAAASMRTASAPLDGWATRHRVTDAALRVLAADLAARALRTRKLLAACSHSALSDYQRISAAVVVACAAPGVSYRTRWDFDPDVRAAHARTEETRHTLAGQIARVTGAASAAA